MSDEFDLERIGDIPDPVAGIAHLPMPPLRAARRPFSATRRGVVAARTLALGATVFYEGAWLTVMSKRADLHRVAPLVMAVEVLAPVAAAGVALTAATARGARGLGLSKAVLAALALSSPLLFVAATLAGSTASSTHAESEPFWWHCGRCFGWTSLYSAGPLVLAVWAFRRSFVAAPAWRMAALAMACAATGAATMSLVCSDDGAAHVLVGHGAAMLVAALVGAWLGRRVGEA